MRTDDGHIIYQCLNGEPEAFGVLVDKYKEGIYAYTYAKLQDWHDAQDVTQETFIQAYRKLHTLKRWDSFAGWLYRIASNFCKNWRSSKLKRPDRDFIEDQNPAIMGKPSMDHYHENEMVESVQEALNSLSETYREVLTLYYYSGMDSNKIAEVLNTSPVAIRLRLSRTRAQLREEMFNMISVTFEQQKLRSGFTFRIVEAIKRIKIHPTSQMKGIPWGVSLAFGMIAVVLSLNPHLFTFNLFNSRSNLAVPAESKVLEFGEIPVKTLKISDVPIISDQQGNGNVLEPSNAIQNALFMAPKAEIGKWVKKADMPTERCQMGAVTVSGKIYAVGGLKVVNGSSVQLSTVEEYDPIDDKWTEKADLPTPRTHMCSAVVNGKIYAISGLLPNMKIVPTVEEYDPVIDVWTKKSDMPDARESASAVAFNNKIYVIGGDFTDDPNAWGPAIPKVLEYDPTTDTWAKKSDMPTPRTAAAAVVVDNKIYVICGFSGGANARLFPTVEIYDPINDTWTKGVDMAIAKTFPACSAVNGKIYVIGGYSGGVAISDVEEYDTGFRPPQAIESKGKLPATWGDKKK